MNNNIPPMSKVVKNTLWIGQFQAGKTTSAIKESKRRQLQSPNLISVFIAYGTNINKENQEGHIRTIYEKNVSLISTREDIKAFKARAQRNELDFYTKPIVISALGHWATLELLQNILSTKSKFRFQLWLDESDSYSKDFDKQKIVARKDNLIDSVKGLEYHQVDEIICITATPFTELVCTTDFSEVLEIEPGEGYVSVDDILANPIIADKKEIESFEEGILSPDLAEYFFEEAKQLNTVTLVTTSSRMQIHKIQAQAISDLLNNEKVLVVEFNSNSGIKYFSKENPQIPKTYNRKDQLQEMFRVAEDYNKLFIVGGGMLDRSVTLKRGKFLAFSSVLFSAGKDSALPPLLQRAARVCGYQNFVPSFVTDVQSKIYLAKIDYPRYIEIAKDNKEWLPRRKALLALKGINYPNPFGRHRHNLITTKNRKKDKQNTISTKEETEDMGYEIINEIKTWNSEDLSPEVLQQLNGRVKAMPKTPLSNFIIEEFPRCNRILNVIGTDGIIYYSAHLPNTGENFRDTLYHWNEGRLTVSNQPCYTYHAKYAVQHIINKDFDCYDEKAALKFTDPT